MGRFYFIIGEFCAEGMSRNYIGHGAKFVIINATTLENATNTANNYAEKLFGKNEYKDLWYGEMHWKWKAKNYSLDNFFDTRDKRKSLLMYHNRNAKRIFEGKDLTKEEEIKVEQDFEENYPIIELN